MYDIHAYAVNAIKDVCMHAYTRQTYYYDYVNAFTLITLGIRTIGLLEFKIDVKNLDRFLAIESYSGLPGSESRMKALCRKHPRNKTYMHACSTLLYNIHAAIIHVPGVAEVYNHQDVVPRYPITEIKI